MPFMRIPGNYEQLVFVILNDAQLAEIMSKHDGRTYVNTLTYLNSFRKFYNN
jgi:hypothetical protein